MTDPEPQQPNLNADDLLGAWECFEGDGFHGWDDRVLVFYRDGGRMILETWLPTRKGTTVGELRLFSTNGVNCFANGVGLTLLVDEVRRRALDIAPAGNGTFRLTVPQTTAGAKYFRRTSMPKNRTVKG